MNSSVGVPAATLRAAIAEIGARIGPVGRQSRLFRTPCFPPGAGPDYVNAAITLSAAAGQNAPEVLGILHLIEAGFERRRGKRWGARTLDLDLIAVDDLVLPDAATLARWMALPPQAQRHEAPGQLLLPHPRLQDRSFVLVPMAEVAPDWVHPLLGLSVAEMLAARPAAEREQVVPIP